VLHVLLRTPAASLSPVARPPRFHIPIPAFLRRLRFTAALPFIVQRIFIYTSTFQSFGSKSYTLYSIPFMITRHISIVIIALLYCVSLFAKGEEWIVYNTTNSILPDNQVHAIAIDNNDVQWIATASGLVRFDGAQWMLYTAGTGSLPSSFITALATNNGTVWVGTDKGLAKYDGTAWTVYDSTAIQGNLVVSRIFCDMATGIVWAGTEKGLLKYEAGVWTRYDDSNSGLAEDLVRSVTVDKNGVLWVGTFDHFKFLGRLWKFDGATWTNTRLDHRELPSSFPDVLTVDRNNVLWLGVKGTTGGAIVRIEGEHWKIFRNTDSPWLHGGISALVFEDTTAWIASGAGLVRYDGGNWMGFTKATSALPDDYVSTVAIDSRGNKWIGTISGGMAVYRTGGVATSVEGRSGSTNHNNQLWNYPNPVSVATTIQWQIPVSGLATVGIYTLAGEQVETLYNDYAQSGLHMSTWQPHHLPNGLYMCCVSWSGGRTISSILVQQ
jgi:hypothetical protein